MAHKKITGVQQYATGTGTGALTLGSAASSLYRTMQAAGMADGDTMYAHIQHATIPSEWEIVLVTYTASGTTISRSFDSKSVSATGAVISFTAGNKIVTEAKLGTGGWDITGLEGPVSVAGFGAVGDGVTDCLAAFEAAIAINGSIVIPAGTYLFSAAWEIAGLSQVSVVGEARGLVILKFSAGGCVVDVPTSSTDDIYTSVTFRHLTFMTNEAGASTGLKILASSPVNMHPTLNDLEFIGSDGVHGPSQSVTGTSHTTTTIDGIASTAGILVNSSCSGTGALAGAYVTAVAANSVTLNVATTSSTTTTFAFNAGPQKYWEYGIDLDGAWFPSITNIRISGGGAGRTVAGIYIHGGTDVAVFECFMSHMEISGCTTAVLVDGQFEGLMLQQFDFYASRDGIVATNAGSLSVGTWQIGNGTIYCSRNPISIDHFSTIQISNMSPVRGFAEFAWNTAAGGVVYNSAFSGGFYYPGTNISIVGPGSNVQLSSLNLYNPFSNTANGIYIEDIDAFMINGVNFVTGTFTNGLNFQGTTARGSFDNIVAWGTITNPVVYGTTGYIRAGSFTHNDNDAAQWSDARTAFSANDATPSVKPLYGKNYFYTANSSATTITQFDDAVPGQVFRVVINDANTTLAHSATLLLKNGLSYTPASGTLFTFVQEGTTYAREVARSSDIGAWTDARNAFSANDTTPSVVPSYGKNDFYTANSSGTTITKFDDAVVGQIWRVLINDANTTLAHGANLLLSGGINYSPPNGAILQFLQEGTTYAREIGRLSPAIVGTTILASSYVKTTPTTVAGLPAAGTAGSGARAAVTDANATTFLSVVAGSGANHVPVFSDGTNWRIG